MSDLTPQQTKVLQHTLWSLLYRFWHHLNQRRRRQIMLLMCLMLISAFAEIISLGAVLPFLGVLAAPEKVLSNPTVVDIAQIWGITSATNLVLPVTVIFIAAALVSNAIRMLLLWSNTRLASAISADIRLEVYRRTLYQPFLVHTARNSSEVISSVVYKANIAAALLQQFLTFLSSMLMIAAIISALLVINMIAALVAVIGFGASYGFITWLFRKRLEYNSQLISRESTQVIKSLQEGLGAIRDVLLDGTQPLYCEIFRRADRPLQLAQGNNIFIGGSPRFFMEALGMMLIAILAYYLSGQAGGVASALPVLGALALGAQRLLPALQQGYAAWINIVSSQTYLADTLGILDQPLPEEMLQQTPEPLILKEAIRFDTVSFRYGSDGPWVLDGLNMNILKGARIGFVGSTGSGKSTTLDLLMGLMEPAHGRILVDGQPIIGERRRAWQRTIAHVPQSIYLSDTTLAENIAFGVPREEINMERVKQAARQARIAAFIESNAEGYNAMVGERGIRLSGGQRQRIGIARALYKQATVLIFDEATSALDNATEQEVIDAIEGLNRELTIVMVAHRLTTVKRCDVIFEMEHGKVVAQGTYENLLESSRSFRNMAMVAEKSEQIGL